MTAGRWQEGGRREEGGGRREGGRRKGGRRKEGGREEGGRKEGERKEEERRGEGGRREEGREEGGATKLQIDKHAKSTLRRLPILLLPLPRLTGSTERILAQMKTKMGCNSRSLLPKSFST